MSNSYMPLTVVFSPQVCCRCLYQIHVLASSLAKNPWWPINTALTLSKAQAKLHPQGLHSSHANLCRGQKNSIMLTMYHIVTILIFMLSAVLQSSNLSIVWCYIIYIQKLQLKVYSTIHMLAEDNQGRICTLVWWILKG